MYCMYMYEFGIGIYSICTMYGGVVGTVVDRDEKQARDKAMNQ